VLASRSAYKLGPEVRSPTARAVRTAAPPLRQGGITPAAETADPRLKPDANPRPFDGKRMIYDGFETIV
jgi:hypothetical protein